ncbi:MAG TPA: hypothetical protein VHJ54_00530 [Solirubrobacterales bacterium]|nr:hypothetical protein [Solirubrobacterales bacterium]
MELERRNDIREVEQRPCKRGDRDGIDDRDIVETELGGAVCVDSGPRAGAGAGYGNVDT